MGGRFVSIWFRYLKTDWFTLTNPDLRKIPFVLRSPSHGRMIIAAANPKAEASGVQTGMVLADARAICLNLEVMDDKENLPEKLLKRLAEWCIRFSPCVAVDLPDGLIIDATGCSHLWGGDEQYVNDIVKRLNGRGYAVRVSMADTPGAAWAMARYGKSNLIVEPGKHVEALLSIPPEGLRLPIEIIERLHKLGLHHIRNFIHMPRQSMRKRFGVEFLQRLDMAIGNVMEMLSPVIPIEPYQERLPCLEPIVTATGIEIGLKELLVTLCGRLRQENKGLRSAVFKCFRVDGNIQSVHITTTRPSHDVAHLFKLFEIKISSIEPALGIDLFLLEAPKVEEHLPEQSKMWKDSGGLDDIRLAELLDRVANKIGTGSIHRYLPDEHYWPERSVKEATSLQETTQTNWQVEKLRPFKLLTPPEVIEVTAPIPDYPPMLFRYKGKIHKIVKADGPERIEQEWWLQQGQHRDYYRVEDEAGHRYWLFRLGHYDDKSYQWFIHGFFG